MSCEEFAIRLSAPMSTEDRNWQVLVVGPQDNGQLGGTFLVAREVAKFSQSSSRPEVLSPEAALEALADGISAASTLIFTIEEGQLSADYGSWARKCLDSGATIVENNVFNLPSRHRPIHDRYIIGFNTVEGAERFIIRSGQARKRRYFACGSVVNHPPVDRLPVIGHQSLTMLRVGRPDPIKWTDWELRFARKMAETLPNVEIVLTLIGVPSSLENPTDSPANLTIHRRENVPDIAMEYAKHDVYLHYSAIGETFGNTLAEAMNAGIFVICALEPSWDCAPLTFLDSATSIVGTRNWLHQHPNEVFEAIEGWRSSGGAGSVELRAGQLGRAYVQRLLEASNGDVEITPGLFEAATSLAARVGAIRGVRFGWQAVFLEYLRGVRMRVRQRG